MRISGREDVTKVLGCAHVEGRARTIGIFQIRPVQTVSSPAARTPFRKASPEGEILPRRVLSLGTE